MDYLRTGIIWEGLEFTIASEKVYPKIDQSFNLFCRNSAFNILTGPDDQSFGLIDLTDDTIFELDLVFGYEGWRGTANFDTPQTVKFRFSNQ